MKKLIKSIVIATAVSFAATSSAGVAVIVSANSTATPTSESDVIKLFLGKKKHIGSTSLVPVDQNLDSASRAAFYSTIVKKSDAQLKSYWSRLIFTGKGQAPQVIGTDADVKRMIASNPNLVGYIDESAVDSSVKVLYKK